MRVPPLVRPTSGGRGAARASCRTRTSTGRPSSRRGLFGSGLPIARIALGWRRYLPEGRRRRAPSNGWPRSTVYLIARTRTSTPRTSRTSLIRLLVRPGSSSPWTLDKLALDLSCLLDDSMVLLVVCFPCYATSEPGKPGSSRGEGQGRVLLDAHDAAHLCDLPTKRLSTLPLSP